MKRICVTIAYDGTDFHGFHEQALSGVRTVEGDLNRALSELTKEEIRCIGASRTDSGVHARGNVAVFDTASSIPAERFPLAAIPHLPPDIRLTGAREVPSDWHPRKVPCVKTYEYVYYCGKIEDPLGRRYASFSRFRPDPEKMREAAAHLVGEHDFTSFANPSSQVLMEGGSAVRTITAIEIESSLPGRSERIMLQASAGSSRGMEPDSGTVSKMHAEADNENTAVSCVGTTVTIRVTGTGFLYNMVRIIAGTLMRVGTGAWEPERVREALEARDRTSAGPTAEARGLTLVGIRYL